MSRMASFDSSQVKSSVSKKNSTFVRRRAAFGRNGAVGCAVAPEPSPSMRLFAVMYHNSSSVIARAWVSARVSSPLVHAVKAAAARLGFADQVWAAAASRLG